MYSHDAEFADAGRTPPLPDPTVFGVIVEDGTHTWAWGPFADEDAAKDFAAFVAAEIDPASVVPWREAKARPGVRVLDPVAELLSWRESGAEDRVREQVAAEIEAATKTWEGMGEAAQERNRGMAYAARIARRTNPA